MACPMKNRWLSWHWDTLPHLEGPWALVINGSHLIVTLGYRIYLSVTINSLHETSIGSLAALDDAQPRRCTAAVSRDTLT